MSPTEGGIQRYGEADDVMVVDVSSGATPLLGTPRRVFTREELGRATFGFYATFGMSADGTRFLVARRTERDAVVRGLTVVENWLEEFRKEKR